MQYFFSVKKYLRWKTLCAEGSRKGEGRWIRRVNISEWQIRLLLLILLLLLLFLDAKFKRKKNCTFKIWPVRNEIKLLIIYLLYTFTSVTNRTYFFINEYYKLNLGFEIIRATFVKYCMFCYVTVLVIFIIFTYICWGVWEWKISIVFLLIKSSRMEISSSFNWKIQKFIQGHFKAFKNSFKHCLPTSQVYFWIALNCY